MKNLSQTNEVLSNLCQQVSEAGFSFADGKLMREWLTADNADALSDWDTVLNFCHKVFGQMLPKAAWHIELHQFRIEASGGLAGKPTPEGIHRDGVDFVLVVMVKRQNISSGTTTMHDLEQRKLDSFTLTAPLDSAIVNDRRCMHGVTPVQQVDVNLPAYRDVLVVTFRNTAI